MNRGSPFVRHPNMVARFGFNEAPIHESGKSVVLLLIVADVV